MAATGFNRQFPRDVIFGSARLGGLEWETMRSIQVYEMINIFIEHVKMNDMLGKLLLISTETQQLIAGTEKPILCSEEEIKYVNKVWITRLRDILIENKLKIQIYNVWHPKK